MKTDKPFLVKDLLEILNKADENMPIELFEEILTCPNDRINYDSTRVNVYTIRQAYLSYPNIFERKQNDVPDRVCITIRKTKSFLTD